MSLWEGKERATAQDLIKWLLSTIRNGGWPVDRVNMVAIDELAASSSKSGSRSTLVMQTLREMSNNGKKTVDDFEVIFERHLRDKKKTELSKSKETWHFFIPIKVQVANKIIHTQPLIRILGEEFRFISLASVERRLGKEGRDTLRNKSLLRIRTRTKSTDLPSVFLYTSAKGSSWHLAWKDLEPAFDALRGMIELTFDFFGFRLISDGQEARRSVPHPLWMTARKRGKTSPEWIHFITDEDSEAKAFELTRKRLSGVQKNASILAKKPKRRSTLSLIANCLRLYSQAMDARFPHLSFLGFWQLGEAITNAEAVGGKTDRVVARLAWHGARIGLKGSGYKGILKVLAKKRNAIVHSGIHDLENDDINTIKLACEAALDWLFRTHTSLPTISHVEHYYRLRESSGTDIDAINDCIDYVKKTRRKRNNQP